MLSQNVVVCSELKLSVCNSGMRPYVTITMGALLVNSQRMIAFLGMLGLLHLYVNIRLTVDVIGWVPDIPKRNAYVVLVWLLPLVGALYVYRQVAPDWFTPETPSDDAPSAVSSGLMGLDAIFNPGSRHVAEAQKKGEITIKAEGELYERKLPEFIDVEAGDTKQDSPERKTTDS